MPVSAVNTASRAATWSRMDAAYSGWMGVIFSTLRVYAPTALFMSLSCLARVLSRNERSDLTVSSGSSLRIVDFTSPCTGMSTPVRRPITVGSVSTWMVVTSGRNWSYGKSVPSMSITSASCSPSAAAP